MKVPKSIHDQYQLDHHAERPEIPNEPRLEISLMMCTIDAFYKTNLDTSEKQMRILKYGRQR